MGDYGDLDYPNAGICDDCYEIHEKDAEIEELTKQINDLNDRIESLSNEIDDLIGDKNALKKALRDIISAARYVL